MAWRDLAPLAWRSSAPLAWRSSAPLAWRFLARFRGLIGVLLVFITIGTLHAYVVKPYRPYDEPAHVAYAYELSHGKLPTLDTKMPVKPIGLKKRPRPTIWVALHPPLYYSLVAPIIRYGSAIDAPLAAVRWARLFSALLSCVGLCFVYGLIRKLKPDDERFAILGTTATAMIPGFLHVSALVHNDSLGFLTSAATMYSALVVVQQGPHWRRLLPLLIWASLSAWTRSSGMITVGIAGLAAGFGALLHSRGHWSLRLGKGALAGAAVSGIALSTIAWFYLRNDELYGDPLGAKKGLELFYRKPGPAPLKLLTSGKFWSHLEEQLWGRFGGGVQLEGGIPELGMVLWMLALVGVMLFLFRKRKSLAAPKGLLRSARLIPATTWVSWGLQVVLLCGLLFSIVWFHSKGGSAHTRYVFAGMWTLGLLAIPGWLSLRSPLALSMISVQFIVLNLLAVFAYASQLYPKKKRDAITFALNESDIENPEWFVALAVSTVVIGTLLVINALRDAGAKSAMQSDESVT